MTTEITPRDLEIHEDVVRLLAMLKEDVDTTSECISAGAYTTLAKEIEGIVTNPVGSMISTFKNFNGSIKNMIGEFTKTYFSKHSEIIRKAFEVESDSRLHYFISFKEDSTENRAVIFRYLDMYESIGLSDNLPIIIEFIPERILSKVNLKNEIKFS